MKKNITKIGVASLISLPYLVLAQTQATNLKELINLILIYLNYLVVLIMGLAVLMFVWNIYKYFILGGDNSESKKEAGLYVMWSIIGFFVMLSFWGLVNILTGTFKLNSTQPTTFFGTYGSTFTSGTSYGAFNTGTGYNNTNGSGYNNPSLKTTSTGTNGSGSNTSTSGQTGIIREGWNFLKDTGNAVYKAVW